MDVPGWRPPRPPPNPPTFAGRMIFAAIAAAALTAIGAMMTPIGLCMWIGIMVAWIRRRRRTRAAVKGTFPKGMREGFPQWRPVVIALLVASFAPFYWSDICPHAEYRGFGPIGVAYSTTGGPCANHVENFSLHIAPHWWIFTR